MGFLNPGLLGLLGLGAIPVVIHLLNRRRYQVVPWPAMAFLLKAQVKTRQRLRMENLLLLLARTLAVLLFAFAASRPFLPSAEALTALGPDRRHLYILLDNSASMDYREGMSSLFERAVQEARRSVDESLRPDDPVTLVLGCDEVRRRNGRPVTLLRGTRDHAKVKETLSRLLARNGGDGSLPSGLSSGRLDPAEALAEVAAVADPSDPRRTLLVLSDFQTGDWAPVEGADPAPGATGAPGAAGAAGAAGAPGAAGAGSKEGAAPAGTTRAIRAQLDRLEQMRFELPGAFRFLGQGDPEDVALLSVGPGDGRAPAEDRPISFEVVVGNNGTAPVTAEVRFLAGDPVKGEPREIGTRSVALRGRPSRSPAPETARVSFTWTAPAGNQYVQAAVTASGDRFPGNDRRGHAFSVRERVRTLLVDGDPIASGDRFPETRLIETCLSLRSGVSATDVRVVPADDLVRETAKEKLALLDVVVLCNVDRVPDAAWDELAEFVRGGGGLFVFLGNKVDPSAWNEACRRPTTADLLPARLAARPVVRGDDPVSLDLGASNHPALKDLTDPRAGTAFEAPLVSGWFPLQEPLPEGTEVLLRLKDLPRSPWLVEKRFGRGHLLLCTSSADLDWTGMSLFLAPFVQETVSYLASSGAERRDLVVHEILAAPVPADAKAIQVDDPSGQAWRDLAAVRPERGGPGTISHAETSRPGIYRVRWKSSGPGADAGARGVPYSVDLDPTEADLARIRPSLLEERFQKKGLGAADGGEANAKVREREAARGDLTGAAVALGLLLVLVEMFLAALFGRKRR